MTTTGTITGTVTDATGAVVPAAQIKLVNKDTGAITTGESNGDGAFVFSGLAVGIYDLNASKEGFKTYSETGIQLHPAIVTNISPVLQPGSITSEITVNAEATAVQTSTPEISNQVSGTEASTLPLNGRNYQSLSALIPGVTNATPDTALNQGGFLTNNVMSINGMGVDGSIYYLDGVTNMNTGSQTYTGITPNPDTLQEVRVLQNNFGSQYSLKGASVVILATKSGTDNFHGTLFEYLRNNDFDARNFFAPTTPKLNQNIFGGTIGGPIMIPGHRSKNPKAFFFGSIQFAWDHVANTELGTTPTAANMSGNFGSLCTAGFNASGICNNSAQQLTNPTAGGAPFAYNQITPSLLNTQAQYLAGVLTQAPNYNLNVPGAFYNFINNAPVINKTRDDEGKIDYNFSSKLHLMVEYLDERQINNNTYDTFLGSPYTTSSDPIKSDNQLAQIQLTATLSPSMVNTLSIATEQAIPYLNLDGIVNLDQVPKFSENLPFKGGFRSNRIPQITFGEGYSPFGSAYNLPLSHSGSLDDVLNDDWSWLHGNHYIQAGYDLDYGTKRQDLFAASNGEWYFSGQFTGNPIADYLIGDSNNFYQQSTMLRPYVHDVISSPYVQDRWKASKRFTLTLGLRVIYEPQPHATPGEDSAFNPALYSAAEAPIVNFDGTITTTSNPHYNPLNGVVLNGINGVPLNFSNAHNWFLAPTVGFAYDVLGDGKTALRGGYGITYETIPAGADCSYTCAANIPRVPSITLESAIFPNPTGAAPAPPGAPSFGDNSAFDMRPVTVENYSLSLEHQFRGDWFASIAGAGNIARHIWGGWNLNQPLPDAPYNYNPLINSDPALPGAAGIYPYVYAPFQGYGSINTLYSMATAYWDALEIAVKHPVGHGVFLNFAYTWQHDLGTSGGTSTLDGGTAQDFYHPGADYGNASLNAAQVFSAAFVWNLPWYNTGHDYRSKVLGGWRTVGILTMQSGFPLNPGLSIPFQGLATRPNRVESTIKGPKTAAEWFNTAAFAAPAYGYFGNAARNSITGPGVVDFDFSVYKDIKVTERTKFQFRAEAFNLPNHTNFSAVSTNFGAGNFGAVTSALDPRIMEFALRFEF